MNCWLIQDLCLPLGMILHASVLGAHTVILYGLKETVVINYWSRTDNPNVHKNYLRKKQVMGAIGSNNDVVPGPKEINANHAETKMINIQLPIDMQGENIPFFVIITEIWELKCKPRF
ncbi:hypothetical protein ACJX0J_022229 [Zea mays]